MRYLTLFRAFHSDSVGFLKLRFHHHRIHVVLLSFERCLGHPLQDDADNLGPTTRKYLGYLNLKEKLPECSASILEFGCQELLFGLLLPRRKSLGIDCKLPVLLSKR